MRIAVHAVGRMKDGPEKELADRYLERFARSGAALGLEFGGVIETPESRARDAETRKREEALRLRVLAAEGAEIILLDERGKNLSSQAFADRIAALRDGGRRSRRSARSPASAFPSVPRPGRTSWCASCSPSSSIALRPSSAGTPTTVPERHGAFRSSPAESPHCAQSRHG